jgi:hypothetical protein
MAKEKKLAINVSEKTPLKWAEGQERTLIDRRVPKNGWKKTFRQYLDRLALQLDKLGIAEATVSFNPSPMDRQDPGVALYFSKPRKQDYSWQVALGIDSPMPTLDEINDAFKRKALPHHPDSDSVRQGKGDPKLWYQFDQHRKNAIAYVKGTAQTEYVIAVDRCTEPRWNLEAIRRILMAVAVMDEYGNPGTLERTFKGFRVALPAHASSGGEEKHGATVA